MFFLKLLYPAETVIPLRYPLRCHGDGRQRLGPREPAVPGRADEEPRPAQISGGVEMAELGQPAALLCAARQGSARVHPLRQPVGLPRGARILRRLPYRDHRGV